MKLKTTNDTADFSLDTFEFADRFKVRPQTVRRRLCESGSYFGFVPVKLPSRRLAWPNVVITVDGPIAL